MDGPSDALRLRTRTPARDRHAAAADRQLDALHRRLPHCVSLYDLTNAFGAVKHSAYAEADRTYLRRDDLFLGDATTYHSLMQLDAIDGMALYRLGDGGLQGHQPIPLKFVQVMAPVVEAWRRARSDSLASRLLSVLDPITGAAQDLSVSVFVDDLARRQVASTTSALRDEVLLDSAALSQALADAGPLQNPGKQVHMPHFVGTHPRSSAVDVGSLAL